MERARVLTVMLPLAALAVAVALALRPAAGDEDPFAPTVFPVDERVAAPDQRVPLLDGEGDLSLGDLAGAPVVVNFWASWCGPCRAEQPELNEAYHELSPQGVAFLGVAVQDSEANARAHWREFDVPYPSVFDPSSRYAAAFGGVGPRALPTTIIVDAEGRIAARIFGATTQEQLRDVLAEVQPSS